MSTVAGGVFYEQDAANEKDWTGFLQFPNKNWRTFVRQREKLRIEKRAAAWYNTTSTSPRATADERSKLYEVHIYLQKS